MTPDELLPCPFCGGKADWGHHDCHDGEHHYCVECGVEVPGDAAAWNRRSPTIIAALELVERVRDVADDMRRLTAAARDRRTGLQRSLVSDWADRLTALPIDTTGAVTP